MKLFLSDEEIKKKYKEDYSVFKGSEEEYVRLYRKGEVFLILLTILILTIIGVVIISVV